MAYPAFKGGHNFLNTKKNNGRELKGDLGGSTRNKAKTSKLFFFY